MPARGAPNPCRLNLSPDEPRTCTSCGKFLPARHFPPPVPQPSGYLSVRRCCRACVNARRRVGPGIASRPPKRNAAGLYHCYECHQYLPADNFGRRRGKVGPYCRPCARNLDAMTRRHIHADPERRARYLAQVKARQAVREKRQQHKRQQQVEFAADAITILRRRGLTKAQICQLGGFSHRTLDRWERGDTQWCRPEPMNRMLALLRATAFLPLGKDLAHGNVKKHPEWERIIEELRWEMANL